MDVALFSHHVAAEQVWMQNISYMIIDGRHKRKPAGVSGADRQPP
jgi:hypothetical protein